MLGRTSTAIVSVILVIIFVSVATATVFTSNSTVTTTSSGYAKIVPDSKNITYVAQPRVIYFNFTLYSNDTTLYVFDYNNVTHNGQSVNVTCFNTTKYPGNYILLNNFVNGTEIHLKLYMNSTNYNYIHIDQETHTGISIVRIIVMSTSGAFAATGFAIVKE
ncbi:MAG: hypothetical protein M1375_02270 [Candidatus Thermoplasmatota archaeon]|jgi:hypothetical protein|nr:hypothetical protein [Candidatus Thermoplasmatota archaeon]MCL5790782.1 hypothetical protein [Candidatus Thermoplasmatota archaeon]